ncbi:hypothetical protein CAP35_12565 [Chitinophagaceae bacterium IBVUCB1]|nr:hypothetical protein CAP35_12565 [Chitinophagaceae bacterium IBVUCB1]
MKGLDLNKGKWVKTSLGELAEDISDREDNPAQSRYERFVGLEHFVSGDLKIKQWASTENLVSATKVFKAGDVLFARRNAYLRRASMVDFDGVCSGDAFVLRENHKKIVPGFLAFILNSDKLWDYANANAAGTMSKRVKWRDLANYEFLLPPKDQQARIAELVWAADDVVQKYERLVTSLNRNYISFEKDSFYKSNDLKELRSVVLNLLGGGTPDTKKKEYYTNGVINWITTSTMNTLYVNKGEKLITKKAVENSATKVLEANNLIVGTRVGVGKCCINEVPIAFSQDVTGLVIDKEKTDLQFLVLQILSKDFQDNLISKARGTTIKGVLKEDLLSSKIYLPEKSKQMVIAADLLKIHNLINSYQSHLHHSKLIQKQLINQVFG